MVAVVCDKSQDNFSTAFFAMVTTVVGVRCKEKDLLSIRRCVVLPPRRSADCRIQKKKKLKPSRSSFPRHNFYKSLVLCPGLVIGNARGAYMLLHFLISKMPFSWFSP
jgi:hypothetical protein